MEIIENKTKGKKMNKNSNRLAINASKISYARKFISIKLNHLPFEVRNGEICGETERC